MALSGTLNFISASEYGVGWTVAAGAVLDKDYTGSFGAGTTTGTPGFIPVDFVGMNTIIYEPLSSSEGVLGYNPGNISGGYHPMSGANLDPGRAWTPYPDIGANSSNPSPRIKTINDPALLFNVLMLHRNGAYGYPTWKQIRTGEHPVARYQRKHGSYSIINPPRRPTKKIFSKDYFTKEVYSDLVDPLTGEIAGKITFSEGFPGKPVPYTDKRHNFREPSVVSAYKSMKHVVSFMDYSPTIPVLKEAIIVHSYQNLLERFISLEPMQLLDLPRFYNKKSTIYNKLVPGYLNENQMPLNMVQFSMGQTIFPTKKNTYKHYARSRPLYEEPAGTGSVTNQTGEGYDQINYRSFWKNKQKNRARTDNQSFNSMGILQSTGAIGGPIIAVALSSTFGGSPATIAWPATPGGNAGWDIAKYIYQSQQYGYSFAATSKWPLDPRKDIGAKYLLGGVGATPNSPNEEAAISSSIGWSSGAANDIGVLVGLQAISDAVFKGMYQVPNDAGTVVSASVHGNEPKPDNVAGGLVYNTAPTLFNLSASTNHINTASYIFGLAHEPGDWGSRFLYTNSLGIPYGLVDGAPGRQIGYATATASLLYQMHNFPWRQPYWAIDKIIGRGPFYDSYQDFSDEIRHIGQGYSVLPEFRISQHMDILEPFDFDMGVQQYPFLTLDGHILSTSLIQPGQINLAPKKEKKKKEQPLIGYDFEADQMQYPGLTPTEEAHQKTFFKTFSHSEFMNTLEETVEEHGGYAGDGVVATSIKLTCKAIKKVLPYNGFFPAQRTVQIASLFSESVGRYILESGSDDMPPNLGDSGKLQTVLEPFFAPGIIYNSIKSGIAVSYPIFTGSVNVLSSTIIHNSSSLYTYDGVFPYMMDQPVRSNLPFEAIYNLDKIPFISGTSKARSKYADKHVGHIVLPNLYKIQNGVGDTGNYHAARSNSVTYEPNATLKKTFKSQRTTEKILYEKAIHNFLAETPRFFLKKQSLTKHVSKPSSQMLPMFRGIKYYMDVVLYQGEHQVMAEGPRERHNGGVDPYVSSSVLREFRVLNDFVTGTAAYEAATTTDVSQFPDGDHRWLALNTSTRRGVIRQLDLSSSTSGTAYPELQQNLRGCIYGHPMITSSNGFAHSASERLRDPAWAAYTPPYFYGKSIMRMCFDPDKFLQEGEFSKTFTLSEIQDGCRLSPLTHYRDRYDSDSNLSTTTMKSPQELKSPAAKSRMKLRSSVEVYGRASSLQNAAGGVPGGTTGFQAGLGPTSNADEHWVIYPKWECPVLDFSGSKDLKDDGTFVTEIDSNKFYVQDQDGKELVIENNYHDGATGKGMWSGYGQDPYRKRKITKVSNPPSGDAFPVIPPQQGNTDALRDKGVFLSIEESYPENSIQTFVGGGEKAQARLIMPIFHNSSSFDGATIRISDGTITKVFELWGQRYNVGRASSLKLTEVEAIDETTGHIIVPITPAGETPSVGGTMESIRCALTGTWGPNEYPWNRALAITVEQMNLNEVYPGTDPPGTTNVSGAVLVITAGAEGRFANGPILINRDVTGSSGPPPLGALPPATDPATPGDYFPINPFSKTGYFIGGTDWIPDEASSTPDKPGSVTSLTNEQWQKSHQVEIFDDVYGIQGFWGGKDPDQFGITVTDPDGDDAGEVYTGNEEWQNYRDGREGRGPGTVKPTIRGSLLEVCGFQQEHKPVGQIAESLTVSEAVVCIPFTKTHDPLYNQTYIEQPLWAPPPAHLFRLNSKSVEKVMHCIIHGEHPEPDAGGTKYSAAVNSQIGDLIRKMRKFVLPPHLDWVGQTLRGGSSTNPSGIPKKWIYDGTGLAMNPFPMLIFDFEHTFQKQELMDIWQGVMPYSSMRAQKAQSSVVVGGSTAAALSLLPNGHLYPHDTHWLVFKAKQRADNEYHNLTPEFDGFDGKQVNLNILNPNWRPKGRFGEAIGEKLTYSYNWPYDFFTMLELVKLESEITLK